MTVFFRLIAALSVAVALAAAWVVEFSGPGMLFSILFAVAGALMSVLAQLAQQEAAAPRQSHREPLACEQGMTLGNTLPGMAWAACMAGIVAAVASFLA